MNIETIPTKAVAEVIERPSIDRKLKSKKKLRVKFGIDPTAPDVHIGHAVPIRKLAEFQRAGHTAVLIIGDATTLIGDPTGKDKTRPALSEKEIKANAKTYLDQIGKILDIEKAEVHRNSEWFGKMTFADVIRLASKVTFAQMMAHDTFRKRAEDDTSSLALHELLYPLMQGYDSVMVKADIELGGMDQKFNLLMGRELQRDYGQPSQDIIMMKYLHGTDGKEKMSKSLGNYIALDDKPSDVYGKAMSIPDELIEEYAELATTFEKKEIIRLSERLKNGENPRDIKSVVASRIVHELYGPEQAKAAETEFMNVFKKGKLPSDIRTVSISSKQLKAFELITKAGLAESNSEAKRLINAGGATLNGVRIESPDVLIEAANGDILKVGKRRIAKISIS